MRNKHIRELADNNFIRDHLMQTDRSELSKYQELVTGERGILGLFKYELITTLSGPIPGALGLSIRRPLYRSLFREVGKSLILGRNVVIRHADKIRIGNRVVIDDQCMIDARGSGQAGVLIGDGVVINRGSIIQAKYGPVEIGPETSIGGNTLICSMGRVEIGAAVLIAGGCYISGGMYHTESVDTPI